MPVPVVHTLLICDAVYQPSPTDKPTALGIFHNIYSPGFPTAVPSAAVLIEMTDARGRVPCELSLVGVGPGDTPDFPVLGMEFDVTFATPLDIVTVVARFPPFSIPRPGEYRLSLESRGEVMAERRLMALQTPR